MPQHKFATTVEQRRSERQIVLYRLDVTDPAGTTLGYLVDVSFGGIRMRCLPGVDVSKVEAVCIHFPRWMGFDEPLTAEGRFAWCKPSTKGRTEGGFVFKGEDEGRRQALESLVDKLAEAALEDGL